MYQKNYLMRTPFKRETIRYKVQRFSITTVKYAGIRMTLFCSSKIRKTAFPIHNWELHAIAFTLMKARFHIYSMTCSKV